MVTANTLHVQPHLEQIRPPGYFRVSHGTDYKLHIGLRPSATLSVPRALNQNTLSQSISRATQGSVRTHVPTAGRTSPSRTRSYAIISPTMVSDLTSASSVSCFSTGASTREKGLIRVPTGIRDSDAHKMYV